MSPRSAEDHARVGLGELNDDGRLGAKNTVATDVLPSQQFASPAQHA